MIKITLPNNDVKKFEKNISGLDIAKIISESLARMSIGIEINGEFFDIDYKIKNDCKINIITEKSKNSFEFLKFKTMNIIEEILNKKSNSKKICENNFYIDFDINELNEKKIEKDILQKIKFFKIEKIENVYLDGDKNKKQIKRIYGNCFFKKSQMEEHYKLMEEVKKRDHKIIGKQLKLFMNSEFSPGSTFFLEKGYFIYRKLQNFLREQYKKQNYKEVKTPNMFNKKLWEISGHWEHYKNDMFIFDVEDQEFSLKPMNCPSHCLIFKNENKSYKDLPYKIADFGALHRNELSGTLTGLARVRKLCQDDAHIFCMVSQIKYELKILLETIEFVYKKIFRMEYEIELSTRPKGFLGDIKVWNKSEKILKEVLNENKKDFEICEGDGAFYGPKIDFRIKDCLNRVWQTATIQLDFNLPNRFDLEYLDKDNINKKPVMIHRAIFGSIERFMAILIEQFAGKFPLWISPNQIMILNVADRHQKKSEEIQKSFLDKDFRCNVNFDNETISNKIRLAQLEKYNYIIVVGDDELESLKLKIRTRKFDGKKNEELNLSLNDFLKRIIKERDFREINF